MTFTPLDCHCSYQLSTQSIPDSLVGKMIIIVFLLSIAETGSERPCRVYSGLGDPCIFPYRLGGEYYAECTTHLVSGSSDPMCPIRLVDNITLDASTDPVNWGRCSKDCDLQQYSNNNNIFEQIVELSSKYYNIAKPFTIGTSSKGQELVGIRISKNVRMERKLLKPMVRFVGNIHGNEAVGREVLLHLSRHLLAGYEVVSSKY